MTWCCCATRCICPVRPCPRPVAEDRTMDAAHLGELMERLGREALSAAAVLARTPRSHKDAALAAAAAAVRRQAAAILAANVRDLAAAQHRALSAARLDRLRLDE